MFKAGLGAYAVVTVADSTDAVREAVALHAPMSDTAIQALGRLLTVTAFMSDAFKSDEKLSISYDASGGLGKLVCAATRHRIRGYCQNKQFDLRDKCGRVDLSAAIGQGTVTVIKDLMLKEPYIGRCAIVNGTVGDDFSYYFTVSEQVPSAVCVGVDVKDGDVKCAGGVFIQLLPDCPEHVKVMLADIARDFVDVPAMLDKMTPEQIVRDRFMAFDITVYPSNSFCYGCTCSRLRMDAIVKSLGKSEAYAILDEQGLIDIKCDFCSGNYTYDRHDVDELFKEDADNESD